jgi:beta-glucosidase
VKGHLRARDAVKAVRPGVRVGATHGMQEWEANDAGRPAMEHVRWMFEDFFLDGSHDDDFVGVQTYTRVPVVLPAALGPVTRALVRSPRLRRALLPGVMRRAFTTMGGGSREQGGMRRTQMGYEWRPEAIGATLRRAASLLPGKDLVVTEHGIATADDAERVEFVRRGLASVHDAIDDGTPVRGYIYWSLLDNFEWAHGYRTTFGLVDVDRVTLQRTPRPSARWLGEVARSHTVR